MANIKEVAKKANTSVATVSRVINENGYVSKEVKQRVNNAIKELNYEPMQRGSKVTKTIAIVIPNIENPFFAKMVREVSKAANKLDYNVLLINVKGIENNEVDFLINLIDRKIDGIVYCSSYYLEEVIPKLKLNNVPIVLFDRQLETTEVDTILINNKHAGYIATEHLLNLGHTNIGFIGGLENNKNISTRYEGYIKAYEDFGLQHNENLFVNGDFTLKSGYENAEKLVKENKNITAIIASNDLMAIGAINYLNTYNIKVPEQISVVGFDDIEICESLTPKLTTVSLPLEKMSEIAIKSITKQISKEKFIYKSVALFPKLVVRNSTAKNFKGVDYEK